jgi:hypothetical protein
MNQKLPQRSVRPYVQDKRQFLASNLFGEWPTPRVYVVYSYGKHWPLFAYEPGQDIWYENEDRASMTTAKHRTLSHPLCHTETLPIAELQALIEFFSRPSTAVTTPDAMSGTTANAGASAAHAA